MEGSGSQSSSSSTPYSQFPPIVPDKRKEPPSPRTLDRTEKDINTSSINMPSGYMGKGSEMQMLGRVKQALKERDPRAFEHPLEDASSGRT
jgi:hypothetical protein